MHLKKLAFAFYVAITAITANASTTYDFKYVDSIGSSSISGVNVGDTATIHLYGNNGGSSIINQSFSPADMLGFTVDVGTFHGSYSTVWSVFSLTTDSFGNVNSIQFYGTEPTSQNSDSIFGSFSGDYVFGNALFTNPSNGHLFTFADSTFNTVPNWSVSPSAVPTPAAAWLFGSGLIGLTGLARKRKAI